MTTLVRAKAPQLDLTKVKAALWLARAPIIRDFGLPGPIANPDDLADALLHSLNQQAQPDVTTKPVPSNTLFEAGVRALGSNQRNWVDFIKAEPFIKTLLHDYDAHRVAATPPPIGALARLLGGRAPKSDATNILLLAKRIANGALTYALVCGVASSVAARHALQLANGPCLTALVSLALGRPSRRYARDLADPVYGVFTTTSPKVLKGMGPPLCSEFLRNLGWNGFKPDTHLKRIVGDWLRHGAGQLHCSFFDHDTQAKCAVVHARPTPGGDLYEFIRTTYVLVAIAPNGVPASTVDNLLWALAKYVHPRRKTGTTPVLDLYLC